MSVNSNVLANYNETNQKYTSNLKLGYKQIPVKRNESVLANYNEMNQKCVSKLNLN